MGLVCSTVTASVCLHWTPNPLSTLNQINTMKNQHTPKDFPWMRNIKASPTPEQAAKIQDYRRVSIAAQNALEAFAATGSSYPETEAWRETYAGLDDVVKAAHLRWSKATA